MNERGLLDSCRVGYMPVCSTLGHESRTVLALLQVRSPWSAHLSPQGFPYYYNARTGESTYTRPPVFSGEVPVAQPDGSRPPLEPESFGAAADG